MALLESKIPVRVAVRNQTAKRDIEETVLSTGFFRLQEPNDSGAPELLFYELGIDPEREFKAIEILLDSGSTNEVFIVLEQADTDLLMKAMRSGVKEVFLAPISGNEIEVALNKFMKRRQSTVRETAQTPQLGEVINVIGCKGGIGTTTIAVNVAVSLIQKANIQSVALLDMNMIFGDIPLFLSLKPTHHWGEVMTNIDRLDATYLKNILSKHQSGLQILASPSYLNGDKPATPEAVAEMVALFQRMYDFVVIDGGQTLDPISMKILEISDKILLVSLLNLSCVSNASKILKSLVSRKTVPKENIRIIINRCQKNADLPLSDAEKSLGKEVFWKIPNDYKTTMSAINNGRPLIDIASNAAVTNAIVDLTHNLIGKKTENAPKNETKTKRWGFLRR
jgi:pilus assembly protein CpaE